MKMIIAAARFAAFTAVACLALPILPSGQALGSDPLQPSAAVLGYPGSSGSDLDLDSLEKRLKKTRSMNLFTKLALKVEFDNLIDDFRLYHGGEGHGAIDALIGRFEGLLGKTLKLVRKGDPALFRTLASSRPALRIALADPAKFAAVLGTSKRSFPARLDR